MRINEVVPVPLELKEKHTDDSIERKLASAAERSARIDKHFQHMTGKRNYKTRGPYSDHEHLPSGEIDDAPKRHQPKTPPTPGNFKKYGGLGGGMNLKGL